MLTCTSTFRYNGTWGFFNSKWIFGMLVETDPLPRRWIRLELGHSETWECIPGSHVGWHWSNTPVSIRQNPFWRDCLPQTIGQNVFHVDSVLRFCLLKPFLYHFCMHAFIVMIEFISQPSSEKLRFAMHCSYDRDPCLVRIQEMRNSVTLHSEWGLCFTIPSSFKA